MPSQLPRFTRAGDNLNRRSREQHHLPALRALRQVVEDTLTLLAAECPFHKGCQQVGIRVAAHSSAGGWLRPEPVANGFGKLCHSLVFALLLYLLRFQSCSLTHFGL